MQGTDNRYKKTYPVSWSQFHNDCRALAWETAGDPGRLGEDHRHRQGRTCSCSHYSQGAGHNHFIDTVCVSSYTVRSQGNQRCSRMSLTTAKDP
jgi:xanthine phosphoribosyltransferase